ncbi:SRPBCC family protein [Chitinimonas koreensis]|uniref:SRPBCC family protein n=1 Tax=Chitinimonas koreensis TaxID=356302 RepID=UPI0004207E5E|nr:SRPBCC domain-containing protein [Chitinimonas koreensis]
MSRLIPFALAGLAFTTGQAAESGIELAVTVKAPVASVWQAWTTSTGITSFFAPEAEVEARPDGPFRIIIDPYAAPGMQGADDMKVLAAEPEKLLSFTWNAPPHLPQARQQRTVVILRFAPEGEAATRLTLSHLGWGSSGEWPQARAYFEKAWPNVLGQLQRRFETGQPQDWTAWRAQLKQWHAQEAAKNKQ